MSKKPETSARKVVTTNRRARHDYDILETFECGVALQGSEVKSLRENQVQLKDAYAEVRKGEVWLRSAHIAPYHFSRDGGHEPERARKLLMHRREIERLVGKINEQGLTLVPLSIYFVRGIAKVEIGLAKGRRTVDKRHAIRDREQKREIERAKSHRR